MAKISGDNSKIPKESSSPRRSPTEAPQSGRLKRIFRFLGSYYHLKAISKVLRSVIKDGRVPYVAIHEGKAATLPVDFTLSRYKGLLFCHSVKYDAKYYWFSYWQSEDAFQSYGQSFSLENTGRDAVTTSGRISDYRLKEEPWWVKYQFWTVIIMSSVLVGAFLSLWERGGQLLESPDIYIELGADHPDNLLSTANGINPIKFSITNRCRFAAVSVDVKAAFVRSGLPGNPPLQDTARLSRIEAGATKDFFIRPELPLLNSDDIPLPYEFRLKAETTAGLWRKKSFDFKSQPMSIWGVIALTSPTLTASPDGRCSVQGVLYSGLAQSGTVQVTAWHPKKAVQSVVVSVVVNGNTMSSRAPFLVRSKNGLTIQQRLEVRAMEQFKPYNYRVDVGIQGIKTDECPQVQVEPHVWEGAKR